MINIEAITIPFLGTINKVNPVIKYYELTGESPAIVLLELYDGDKLVTTVEQPIGKEVYGDYTTFFNAFKERIVEWTLSEQKIQRS